MSAIEQTLMTVPFLKTVSTQELKRATRYFTGATVPEGHVLWREGDPAAQLGIALNSGLHASTVGVDLGSIGGNELIGEAATFFRGVARSATVQATEPVRVVLLQQEDLAMLRREESPVYDALLDEGLRATAARIRQSDLLAAQKFEGDREAPNRKEQGALTRWLRTFKRGGECPPIRKMLTFQPGLSRLNDRQLDELAGHWEPVELIKGQPMCLEGDTADALWLVAVGQVDVLRHVGDKAQRLAKIGPGDVVGLVALVAPGNRTASLVPATDGWALTLSQTSYRSLNGSVRRVWRESLLASLATTLRVANLRMTRPQDSDALTFRDRMREWHLLDGLPLEAA